ncbi:disulfide bond formation protein B [Oleomonas cavernae]|uniref:Putative protein-disulfide oxidoreductase DsbI n=1 Tax=Oleomonas cavernae TaxID=2320859 RepID=A0A418WU10_9PROT|nr:disulfide bond formation protein B [Oleomonas cavernae]RJF94728.1 disulfide bond formation protein B [Oleomonas cavernae]
MRRARNIRLAGLVILLGSGALLGGALAFQYLGGLPPCELCIWQRWAHGAVLAGALAAVLAPRPIAALGLAIGIAGLLCGVGIAIFHVGVEQAWWQGLASCGATGTPATSVDDLLAAVEAAPVVRCGDVAWSLFGLSMAAWNAIASLVLAIVATVLARRRA